VIESRPLSLDIDDHEDLTLLFERLAPGAGSEHDPGLASWLNRYFARGRSAAGITENADCA
jgi:hypothetical protein